MRAIRVYDILNIAAFRLNYRVVLEFPGIFIYNNSVTFQFVLQEVGEGTEDQLRLAGVCLGQLLI